MNNTSNLNEQNFNDILAEALEKSKLKTYLCTLASGDQVKIRASGHPLQWLRGENDWFEATDNFGATVIVSAKYIEIIKEIDI